MEITKINFTSNGRSNRVYQINPTDKTLLIYKNQQIKDNNGKPYKTINFDSIREVLYGVTSENLKKRYKTLITNNLKDPWLFMSLVLDNNRTVDLYFNDENRLVNWFYGVHYFIKGYALSTKILTKSGFLMKKFKLRLITLLKDMAESDEVNPHKTLLVLTQLKNYAQHNNYGFHSLSFLKVFLLYYKIMRERNGGKDVIAPIKYMS
jgi:hypothetical protein